MKNMDLNQFFFPLRNVEIYMTRQNYTQLSEESTFKQYSIDYDVNYNNVDNSFQFDTKITYQDKQTIMKDNIQIISNHKNRINSIDENAFNQTVPPYQVDSRIISSTEKCYPIKVGNYIIQVCIKDIRVNNVQKQKNSVQVDIQKDLYHIEVVNKIVLNHEIIYYIYSLMVMTDLNKRYIGNCNVLIPEKDVDNYQEMKNLIEDNIQCMHSQQVHEELVNSELMLVVDEGPIQKSLIQGDQALAQEIKANNDSQHLELRVLNSAENNSDDLIQHDESEECVSTNAQTKTQNLYKTPQKHSNIADNKQVKQFVEEEQVSKELSTNKKSMKKKLDNKNVVKNFTKAFKNYIINQDNDDMIKQICEIKSQEDLKKYKADYLIYFKQKKFNNMLIRELFVSEYKLLFYYFLEHEALTWLESSQVQDKDAHRKTLVDWIKAYNEPTLLDEKIVLKRKKPIISF